VAGREKGESHIYIGFAGEVVSVIVEIAVSFGLYGVAGTHRELVFS
jgi:hypothetical protein